MGDNTRRARMYRSHGTEDELQPGIYLQVRPRDRISELERRPGDTVIAVEEGSARIYLGDRQQRIVGAGEVVRIPSEMPHAIESVGEVPLRVTTDG